MPPDGHLWGENSETWQSHSFSIRTSLQLSRFWFHQFSLKWPILFYTSRGSRAADWGLLQLRWYADGHLGDSQKLLRKGYGPKGRNKRVQVNYSECWLADWFAHRHLQREKGRSHDPRAIASGSVHVKERSTFDIFKRATQTRWYPWIKSPTLHCQKNPFGIDWHIIRKNKVRETSWTQENNKDSFYDVHYYIFHLHISVFLFLKHRVLLCNQKNYK